MCMTRSRHWRQAVCGSSPQLRLAPFGHRPAPVEVVQLTGHNNLSIAVGLSVSFVNDGCCNSTMSATVSRPGGAALARLKHLSVV